MGQNIYGKPCPNSESECNPSKGGSRRRAQFRGANSTLEGTEHVLQLSKRPAKVERRRHVFTKIPITRRRRRRLPAWGLRRPQTCAMEPGEDLLLLAKGQQEQQQSSALRPREAQTPHLPTAHYSCTVYCREGSWYHHTGWWGGPCFGGWEGPPEEAPSPRSRTRRK